MSERKEEIARKTAEFAFAKVRRVITLPMGFKLHAYQSKTGEHETLWTPFQPDLKSEEVSAVIGGEFFKQYGEFVVDALRSDLGLAPLVR